MTEELGLHNLRPNPGSTKATKRLGRGKGSGQGLSIAHNIIAKKHGGSIQFQSQVGQGAIFTIRLPLREKTENMTASGNTA